MKDKRITAGANQLRRSPQILIGSNVGKTTPPRSNCRIKVGDKNRSDMVRSNLGRYAHKEHGADVPSLSRMITISRQSMTKRRHNRRWGRAQTMTQWALQGLDSDYSVDVCII